MSLRYAKSDAGRLEIKGRALPLSRPARNLLLVIDGTRTGSEWLGLVQGASQADFDGLLAHGLVEPAGAPPARAPREERPAPALPNSQALHALQGLPYRALYDFLTAQSKARFGLIKGYRLVLDIERCTALPELQALAGRFVEQVRQEQGEAGLKPLREALQEALHTPA